MWCAVYKSRKRADTYLYVLKRDDFSQVPSALMQSFGAPQFVLVCDLDRRQRLGLADLDAVRRALSEQGFYLQLPPPPINLLDEEKAKRGVVCAKA